MTIYDAYWRKKLIARLAAERSYLLGQLWGLDEVTLCQQPVMGVWTAKDFLPHIGAWDAFHTHRMQMVADGRIDAIEELAEPDGMDRRNVALYERYKALPLHTAVAILLKERGGFLATLDRVPDKLLHRRITLPWGWQTQMRTWSRWRFLHDAAHAEHLKVWRATLPAEIGQQRFGPKYILRAIVQATRKDFLKTALLVPEAARDREPVCGRWSLKELVGHLTDWEQVGVEGLQFLAEGETPEFGYEIGDFDAFNSEKAAARQEQTWREVWQAFEMTHQRLLALFDRLPDDALSHPFTSPWQRPSTGYLWMTVWARHIGEHAVDVRKAVGLKQWPGYLMGR